MTEVRMPKLGVEMTAARILAWLKQDGEWVRRGEALVTIETEKVTYDVHADAEGWLQIVGVVDAELPVGAILARLAATRRDAEPAATTAATAEPVRARGQGGGVSSSATTTSPRVVHEVRATPLARKVARLHGIDIETVAGSGVLGRIREADVLRAVESCQQRVIECAGADPALASAPSGPAGDITRSARRRVARRTPFRGIRKVIARNLHEGLQTMAQMTDLGEMDVTEVVRLRDQLNREPALVGAEVSYTDLFVKAAALVLREMPRFNASLEGDEIVEWADVNVAVAVSVDGGLLVPVVHGADGKSLKEIHAELARRIDRARRGTLALDDVSSPTFTLTNFGSYGSFMGTPLINPPQVAVLGTGQIVEKAVVHGGQIVVRWMMGYGLTIDHRVLDGADAGRFMARFRGLCDRPAVLLLP